MSEACQPVAAASASIESQHVPMQAQRCWRGQSYAGHRHGSDYGLMVAGFEPCLPQCGYAYLTTLPTIKNPSAYAHVRNQGHIPGRTDT